MSAPDPLFSVIVPAHESQATLGPCLAALRAQTRGDFEVLVADSSPGPQTAELVRRNFPEVRFFAMPELLLPFPKRNRAAGLARGRLLAFLDPDAYPAPDWLERLAEAHEESGGPVAGAVDCHGRRRRDLAVHLAKFDLWLPGGPPGIVEIAPSVNFLCPKELFLAAGGFPEDTWLGDTVFSWELARRGQAIRFAPRAVVRHHHLQTWPRLLGERLRRGRIFGRRRAAFFGWGRARLAAMIPASLLPLRLPVLLLRRWRAARRAGWGAAFLLALPLLAPAHAAWLWGEAAAYAGLLAGRRRP